MFFMQKYKLANLLSIELRKNITLYYKTPEAESEKLSW